MAQLPPIKRIVKEDFSDQPWAEKLLWPINRFMESVFGALDKGLTLGENLSAEIKTLTFTDADFPIRFNVNTPRRPTDVLVTRIFRTDGTALASAITLDWSPGDGNIVIINNILGLVATEQYTARFLVFGE